MDSNYDVQNIYKIVNGSIIKGTATKEKNNVYSRWEDSKYVIVGSAPSVSPKKEIYFSYEDAKRARRKIIKKEIPAFLIWTCNLKVDNVKKHCLLF